MGAIFALFALLTRAIAGTDQGVDIQTYLNGAQLAAIHQFGNTVDVTQPIKNAINACTVNCNLIFPPGYYYSATCNFSLSRPTAVMGFGSGNVDNNGTGTTSGVSIIACGSNVNNLFTVTSDMAQFKQIALLDVAPLRTSGTAIFVNSPTNQLQRVDYDNIYIFGFQDAIDSDVGWAWHLSNSHIFGFSRYGVKIRNVLNVDAGAWRINNDLIFGGPGATNIRIESSGGGSISNSKIGSWTSPNAAIGISMQTGGVNASYQTAIVGNDIEDVTGSPIDIEGGWPAILISSNILSIEYSPPGVRPVIICKSCDKLVIVDNVLIGQNGGSAIELAGSDQVVIGPQLVSGFAQVKACDNNCTNVYDYVGNNFVVVGIP